MLLLLSFRRFSSLNIVLLFFLLFKACSPIPETKIIYQSQKDVLIEAIEEYPTEVLLSAGDANVATERLKILFNREIKVKPQILKAQLGENFKDIVSWLANTKNLTIRISRRLTEQGHLFTVNVSPRTAEFARSADLTARNIARYIKTGIFERSLYQG